MNTYNPEPFELLDNTDGLRLYDAERDLLDHARAGGPCDLDAPVRASHNTGAGLIRRGDALTYALEALGRLRATRFEELGRADTAIGKTADAAADAYRAGEQAGRHDAKARILALLEDTGATTLVDGAGDVDGEVPVAALVRALEL